MKKVSSSFLACFLYILQPKCLVSSAMGSCLVLVGTKGKSLYYPEGFWGLPWGILIISGILCSYLWLLGTTLPSHIESLTSVSLLFYITFIVTNPLPILCLNILYPSIPLLSFCLSSAIFHHFKPTHKTEELIGLAYEKEYAEFVFWGLGYLTQYIFFPCSIHLSKNFITWFFFIGK